MNSDTYTAYQLGRLRAADVARETELLRVLRERATDAGAAAPRPRIRFWHVRPHRHVAVAR